MEPKMPKFCAENERVKRAYFTYLKEAKRHSEASVDKVARALHQFEAFTGFKNFKGFRIEQAVRFKAHLAKQVNKRTGKPLSKATMHSTVSALRAFVQWLAGQPGFKSRITYADADYFNLSEKDVRIATARRPANTPTIEQIRHVLHTMGEPETDIERRDRALIAFTLLTGMRDAALASVKLKHVDLASRSVFQDAREVNTKFSKSFTTWFFRVGDDIEEIVVDWITYLRTELLWGEDDPLFPATEIQNGPDRRFRPVGVKREHWSTAEPIRRIFRKAFEKAKIPYYNPHSFRNTLTNLGQRLCQAPEAFKAWSQNLGHDHVMTTLMSYGTIGAERQAEIVRNLSDAPT